MLSASDPANRYAEHKKQKAFYDAEIFYYQGTGFIASVEAMLVEEMKKFLGASQVETSIICCKKSEAGAPIGVSASLYRVISDFHKMRYFDSHPRVGGDQRGRFCERPRRISIRTPAWGVTSEPFSKLFLRQFQFAPPRGG